LAVQGPAPQAGPALQSFCELAARLTASGGLVSRAETERSAPARSAKPNSTNLPKSDPAREDLRPITDYIICTYVVKWAHPRILRSRVAPIGALCRNR
jgi:hypothetical protein